MGFYGKLRPVALTAPAGSFHQTIGHQGAQAEGHIKVETGVAEVCGVDGAYEIIAKIEERFVGNSDGLGYKLDRFPLTPCGGVRGPTA